MTPPDPMPPAAADRLAADIAAVLQAAWDDIEMQRRLILATMDDGPTRRSVLARLAEFTSAAEAYRVVTAAETARYVRVVAGQYAAGVLAAHPARTSVVDVWSLTHESALEILTSDAAGDLLARSVAAGRTTDRFARAVRAAADELLSGQATGQTAVDVGRRLADRLRAADITAVTYRDGAVYSIEDYTMMAARTKGRVAFNAGTLNEYDQYGIGWVEVMDGTRCGWTSHDDPDRANGSFRTVQDAADYPISHPNCLRAFGARPDITTAQDAAAASPTVTEAQNADQEAFTVARTQARAVREGRQRRATQAARRATRQAGAIV